MSWVIVILFLANDGSLRVNYDPMPSESQEQCEARIPGVLERGKPHVRWVRARCEEVPKQ